MPLAIFCLRLPLPFHASPCHPISPRLRHASLMGGGVLWPLRKSLVGDTSRGDAAAQGVDGVQGKRLCKGKTLLTGSCVAWETHTVHCNGVTRNLCVLSDPSSQFHAEELSDSGSSHGHNSPHGLRHTETLGLYLTAQGGGSRDAQSHRCCPCASLHLGAPQEPAAAALQRSELLPPASRTAPATALRRPRRRLQRS